MENRLPNKEESDKVLDFLHDLPLLLDVVIRVQNGVFVLLTPHISIVIYERLSENESP